MKFACGKGAFKTLSCYFLKSCKILRQRDTLTEQVIACASKEVVRCLKIKLKQNQKICLSFISHPFT